MSRAGTDDRCSRSTVHVDLVSAVTAPGNGHERRRLSRAANCDGDASSAATRSVEEDDEASPRLHFKTEVLAGRRRRRGTCVAASSHAAVDDVKILLVGRVDEATTAIWSSMERTICSHQSPLRLGGHLTLITSLRE